jgi:ADP-heptose:LPS heptosyltransferase
MGLQPVLIGSKAEIDSLEALADLMESRPVVAAGVLTFRQMGALVAHSKLLIGGDSGPMHVAGAVGVPYLALFGSTPADARAPLQGPGISLAHPVACGPCDWLVCKNTKDPLLCLDLIDIDEAYNAIQKLMAKQVLESVSTSQT